MVDPFFDDPQTSAGRVFDQPFGSDLKSTDPFAATESRDPGFLTGKEEIDPFDQQKGQEEELGEEEIERLQAAERAYQAMMQRLYEKEGEERSLKEESQSVAQQTLAKWREERLRQTEQRKSLNREQEAAFLEARKKFKAGNPWKNVCSMIDFKEKSDGKDVSRMRSVLLARKNEA